ncbi:MAG: hypothetical protein EA361_07715 [Bacteroidetes bacterium]|nr:MAG: hypothetical protein EA361_07715 [Bacteroidota bacterium]
MKKTIISHLSFLLLAISCLTCQVSLAQSVSDTLAVRRLMEEGIIKLQNNELRQAIQLFDQGREMLHKTAVAIDERNQAIITSNQFTRDAERQIQQGNLESAFEMLNKAIELNADNVEALKFRGSIRLIQEQQKPRARDRDYIGLINDYTNAIRIVDRKVNTSPRNSQERKEYEREKAKILINRAYVKMQANRTAAFNSAIEDYTEAIRSDDQNWDGFLGRAVAYNKIRDNRREVNDYLRAIDLMQRYDHKMSDQDWGELYLTVAQAYVNLRDNRNAFEYATRAFNLGNHDAERIMLRNRP